MISGKVGRQGWADRRVAMAGKMLLRFRYFRHAWRVDANREPTGMYLQRVGLALLINLFLTFLREKTSETTLLGEPGSVG